MAKIARSFRLSKKHVNMLSYLKIFHNNTVTEALGKAIEYYNEFVQKGIVKDEKLNINHEQLTKLEESVEELVSVKENKIKTNFEEFVNTHEKRVLSLLSEIQSLKKINHKLNSLNIEYYTFRLENEQLKKEISELKKRETEEYIDYGNSSSIHKKNFSNEELEEQIKVFTSKNIILDERIKVKIIYLRNSYLKNSTLIKENHKIRIRSINILKKFVGVNWHKIYNSDCSLKEQNIINQLKEVENNATN